MELIQQKINGFLGSDQSLQYDVQFGTTPDEFPYAIFTMKARLYRVYCFGLLQNSKIPISKKLQISDILKSGLGFHDTSINPSTDYINAKRPRKHRNTLVSAFQTFQTEAEAKQRIQECKNEIQNGIYNCMFTNWMTMSKHIENEVYFGVLNFHSNAIQNPDNFLQPGDILSISFVAGSSHYVGNGEVVHVSGHGGGKDASVARIGKLCPDFVKSNGFIQKLIFSYSLRKPERIVEIAKNYAQSDFRKGTYNLLSQNCQHFVTLCALGFEISPDKQLVYGILDRI